MPEDWIAFNRWQMRNCADCTINPCMRRDIAILSYAKDNLNTKENCNCKKVEL